MSRVSSRTKLNARQKAKKNNVDLEVKKVEVPQLAWRIVSETSAKSLRETTDIDVVARKLSDILSLTASQESMKEAAILDYFVAGYWHAINEWNFTDEQTSAFITILDIMLNNIRTRSMCLSENIKELQALVAGVGVPNNTTSLECFTAETVTTVFQYLQTTLFQHYLLFEYLFTEGQAEELHTAQVSVELPNLEQAIFPPPMEEAIPLELYERYMAPEVKSESSSLSKDDQEPKESSSQEEVATQSGEDVTDAVEEEEVEISADDLKTLIESTAQITLQSFQTQMLQKIKEKEELISHRLAKLEKALHSHH